MSVQTKILIVEHDPNDLELIQNELKKGGINYTAEIVQDGPAYEMALKNFIPDIILSDYSLPSFDGLTAFKIREQMAPDTPFIFVSGTIGEENSIELIRNGVTDFVLKDKLFTLNIKINRALKEAKENQQKIETEQKLIQSESRLSRAQQLAHMGSWEKNFETGKLEWSAETHRIFNCDPKTFMPTADSLISMIHPEDRKAMENWIASSSSGINPGPLDYRLNTSDGSVKYIHGQAEIIFNEAGKAIKAIGTSQDITERKKVQQNLEKSLKEVGDYKYAIDQSSTVEITDSEGKIIFANDNFCKLLKYTKEELIGQDHRIMNSGYHPKSFFTQLWNTIKSGKTFKGEVRNKAKDGSFLWLKTVIVPFIDKNGESYQYMIFREDITEHKKAESKLLDSQFKWDSLVNNTTEVILIIANNHLVTYINNLPKSLSENGVTIEKMIGKNYESIVHPFYLHSVKEHIEKSFSENVTTSFLMQGNITNRYYECVATPLLQKEKFQGLIVIMKDCTERINAEEELRQSEKSLKESQAIAHLGSWEVDFATKKVIWSDESCRIYGVSPEENQQVFESWLSFVHPEDLGYVKEEINKSEASLSDSSFYHRIIRRDGTIRHVFSVTKYKFNRERKPIGIYGIAHDITEQKIAEEKIIENEFFLRESQKSANIGSYRANLVTGIWQSSETLDRIFGIDKYYDRSETGWLEIVHPDDRQEVNTFFRSEVLGKQKSFNKEYRIARINDKQIRWVQELGDVKFDTTGAITEMLGTIQDITERKNIFDKLVKSETQIRNFANHLNHVLEDERTRIAREIHDEFGQQFSGIKMGLSLFKKLGTADKTMEEKANSMIKDVDSIIQSLKKVATELRPGILDTLGLIPSIEWLAQEFEAKSNIKCKLELNVQKQKFEEKVSICFFRICQEALTNVSKHAKASKVIISVSQDKNELTLKISDNGKGFSSENPVKPFSMGLIGMRERANIIGADFQIVSKKDLGTTIQLQTKLS